MADSDLKHNRASEFLKARKHNIEYVDAGHVNVDNEQWKVLELHKLAAKLHDEEWKAAERKYNKKLKGRKT
jgi:hypothetical protein